MNSNIYQIEQDYLKIVEELENSEGELTPELEKSLEINKEEFNNKMLAYIHVIKQKQADIGLAKDEITRLRTKTTSDEKVIDRLKSTMMQAMEVFELYGKTGNLSCKIDNYSLFTRMTESVEVIKEVFTTDEEEQFKDILAFTIKSKLTKFELSLIIKMFKDSDIVYDDDPIQYDTIIVKDNFKELVNTLSASDVEKDIEKLNELNKVAVIKEKQSLTIK